MTVEFLIKCLSQYPPETQVLVEFAPNQYALINDASPTTVRKEDIHSTKDDDQRV
jgi:hypothetical protein